MHAGNRLMWWLAGLTPRPTPLMSETALRVHIAVPLGISVYIIKAAVKACLAVKACIRLRGGDDWALTSAHP